MGEAVIELRRDSIINVEFKSNVYIAFDTGEGDLLTGRGANLIRAIWNSDARLNNSTVFHVYLEPGVGKPWWNILYRNKRVNFPFILALTPRNWNSRSGVDSTGNRKLKVCSLEKYKKFRSISTQRRTQQRAGCVALWQASQSYTPLLSLPVRRSPGSEALSLSAAGRVTIDVDPYATPMIPSAYSHVRRTRVVVVKSRSSSAGLVGVCFTRKSSATNGWRNSVAGKYREGFISPNLSLRPVAITCYVTCPTARFRDAHRHICILRATVAFGIVSDTSREAVPYNRRVRFWPRAFDSWKTSYGWPFFCERLYDAPRSLPTS